MRYKILIGSLVLAIIILSGLTYRYYSIGLSQQATINNMRGQIIVTWARQMDIAASYLNNTSTNIDMQTVRNLLRSISDVTLTTYTTEGGLYTWMPITPEMTADNLAFYCEGAPSTVRNISLNAISMIQNLAQKMHNTSNLIINFNGPYWDLTHLNGQDPIKILENKGVIDPMINGCTDIRDLSAQIRDFNPKFQ